MRGEKVKKTFGFIEELGLGIIIGAALIRADWLLSIQVQFLGIGMFIVGGLFYLLLKD